MVFEKAVDVYRSMEQSQSSAEDKEAAAHAIANENGRELLGLRGTYEEYDCTGCVDFFLLGSQLTPDEQEDFCRVVVVLVFRTATNRVTGFAYVETTVMEILLYNYCNELLQCPFTPTICCQSQGVCLNWEAITKKKKKKTKSQVPEETEYSG